MKLVFRTLLIGSALTLLNACTTPPLSTQTPTISLVELLANPRKFNKMHICVSGFYHKDVECSALYLSLEDARHGIVKNSIFLSGDKITSSKLLQLNNSYCSFWGVVNWDAQGGGHLRLFGLELVEIDRVSLRPIDPNVPQSAK